MEAVKPYTNKRFYIENGKCVIFNHMTFDRILELSSREGTDKDARDFGATFSKLNCQVVQHDDKSSHEIELILTELAAEHAKYDALIVCIMTHGETNDIIFTKDSRYSVESLRRTLDQTWVNKPKILILQACQGVLINRPEKSVYVEASPDGANGSETDSPELQPLKNAAPISIVSSSSPPLYSDWLVVHSTIPGYVAFRNPQTGSWFIQELVKSLNAYGNIPEFDLQAILTKVTEDVSKRTSVSPFQGTNAGRQICETRSTMTGRLFFGKNSKILEILVSALHIKNVGLTKLITDSNNFGSNHFGAPAAKLTNHQTQPITYDWINQLRATTYLGKGSFGIVVKVGANAGHPDTAVKLIFPTYSFDPVKKTKEENIRLREFHLLDGKSHCNVVKSLNFVSKKFKGVELMSLLNLKTTCYGDEAEEEFERYINRANKTMDGIEGICIQMELCGRSLRSWVMDDKNKRIIGQPDAFRVRIGQGIISGLKFLHENEILHRDLKPENIYFSMALHTGPSEANLPVKIGDFGLSRDVDGDMSQTLTLDKGTRLYRAPEVSKKYGKQADLYSLGLILWELFESIPYNELEPQFRELVYSKQVHLVAHNPFIPNLREIIIGLTMKDKQERFQPGVVIDLCVKSASRESSSNASDESWGLC